MGRYVIAKKRSIVSIGYVLFSGPALTNADVFVCDGYLGFELRRLSYVQKIFVHIFE